MAQNTDVLLPEIGYTRADYTALRAYVLKIPLDKIADLYYSEDSPQVLQGLERFLTSMRDHLVERAIVHNPAFADILKAARRGGAVTDRALGILVRAADLPPATPAPGQPVSQWFRPRTAAALKAENIATLAELTRLINRRGAGWWRGIARIGALRAKAILGWLRRHGERLGPVDIVDHPRRQPVVLLQLDPARPDRLAPLGGFSLPAGLDGSAGTNRADRFCLIQAGNDLQAVEFYLSRFDDQPHTRRAYRRELERFLLWCILVRAKPMSSMLVGECEAYKCFLARPSAAFAGVRAPRFSARWRPFSTTPMAPRSQRQAVVVLRAAFDYLVKVRYLAGNPWVVVRDPRVAGTVYPMQIERALGRPLWAALSAVLGERAAAGENTMDRTALAVVLLMGDSGLRRDEVAGARRSGLARWNDRVWFLRILGKRNKLRDVPVSDRTVEALRAHWADRHLDFDRCADDHPLLRPVAIPGHAAALARHADGTDHGYTANGLYRVVTAALRRARADLSARHSDGGELDELDFAVLGRTTPHAFRHTYGTLATEAGMPLDVVQTVLGHASGTTTSIYVRAKQKRMAEEAEKYHGSRE